MSVRVMNAVFDSRQKEIKSPGRRLVMLALADNANDEGKCWPSVATLVDKTDLDRTTVIRALHAFRDCGALTIKRRGPHSSLYRINVAWLEAVRKEVADRHVSEYEEVASVPEEVASSAPKRLQESTQNHQVEPPKNHQGGDAPAREASPSEDTPPSPEPIPDANHPALRAYFEITGRRAVPIHFQVTITARVGDDPARLEAWRELLYVWKATTEPGHVGTPYNLGNVPRMLEALEEKAGRRRTDTTAPTSKPAGGMNMFQAMDEAEKRGVSLSEGYVKLPSGYWTRRPQAQA